MCHKLLYFCFSATVCGLAVSLPIAGVSILSQIAPSAESAGTLHNEPTPSVGSGQATRFVLSQILALCKSPSPLRSPSAAPLQTQRRRQAARQPSQASTATAQPAAHHGPSAPAAALDPRFRQPAAHRGRSAPAATLDLRFRQPATHRGRSAPAAALDLG